MSPFFSGPRGNRTLISGVRSRRRPVGPAAQSVIPDGLEPSLPGCRPGVVAAGPRDRRSSRGGNRTHKLSPGSRPGRFADLRTRPSSCGGRIRTGVERLMRPCWKPDSSPLRSDQGESRTPTPVTARRSERRVSSSSTTWPCSPYGNRTHPSGLRGRRPFADRRTGRQCVGQELNLHSSKAAALQAVRLANAQPAHVLSIARVGIEPTDDHQGLSLAALPVCVPCQRMALASVPDGIRTHDLHRDRVASTPGCSTRTRAEGEGVEPSRLIARPFSRRLPSPIGLPFRDELRRQESNLQSSP
jgi:hypothetical protein